MSNTRFSRHTRLGVAAALLAVLIWSGNFIIARAAAREIPPVSLAFFRWLTATLLLLLPAWKHFRAAIPELKKHIPYMVATALMGVTVFNTLVYVAGHHTTAVNMALLGTTASPLFAFLLGILFFQERVSWRAATGMLLCLAGILVLLSHGSWQQLSSFHFTTGDYWILGAALSFAVYTLLVKRKPKGLHPVAFLFTTFLLGTLMLLPAWLAERSFYPPVHFTPQTIFFILYLGAGASVIAFMCWNLAIRRLGPVKTALFGNLIPVCSSVEAVWLLHEKLTWIHALSGSLVIGGILLASLPGSSKKLAAA